MIHGAHVKLNISRCCDPTKSILTLWTECISIASVTMFAVGAAGLGRQLQVADHVLLCTAVEVRRTSQEQAHVEVCP